MFEDLNKTLDLTRALFFSISMNHPISYDNDISISVELSGSNLTNTRSNLTNNNLPTICKQVPTEPMFLTRFYNLVGIGTLKYLQF